MGGPCGQDTACLCRYADFWSGHLHWSTPHPPTFHAPLCFRLAFASLLLEHCCRVVASYSGVIALAVGALVVQMVYICMWSKIVQVCVCVQVWLRCGGTPAVLL